MLNRNKQNLSAYFLPQFSSLEQVIQLFKNLKKVMKNIKIYIY